MRKWKYVLLVVILQASLLEADVPDPVGVWEFNTADPLAATVGDDLELVITEGAASDYSVDGITESDGARGIGEGSYYRCPHGIAANGGGSNVNEWTLLIDFYYPAESLTDPPNGYNDLLQCDYTNQDDSDWTIRSDKGIGISAVGYSTGFGYTADPNIWYRMVVPIDNETLHDLYMDGAKIFTGNPQPIDGRFSLHPTGDPNGVALLFCAGNNQDGDDAPIHVSTVAVWDQTLSYGECVALRRAGDSLYPSNAAPEVDAGESKSAELGQNGETDISLDGSVIDDGSYDILWEKISGPNDVIFDDATAEDPTATFVGPGPYILRFTVDDGEFVESDEVSILIVPYQYKGPRVHWKFDEPWNGTTVLDSSGLYNNGTLIDGATGFSSYTSGIINNCLDLNNGQDINSQFGDRVALNYVMTDSGTIAVWMNPYAIYNYNAVFDNSVAANDWEMWIYGAANLYSVVRGRIRGLTNDVGSTEVSCYLNGVAPDGDITGDWFHLTFTWNRTSATTVDTQLYINANLIMERSGRWVDPGTTFYLGAGNSGNEASYAKFDDFRMYARVLSPCEIWQIQSEHLGANPPPYVNAGPDLPAAWLNEPCPIDATIFDPVDADCETEDTYSVQWSKISGPNDLVIHSPNAEDTDVTFSALGTYELQIEVTDSASNVSTDTVTVEVLPPSNRRMLVHWTLDDGQYDPTVTDTSGNGNDGTWADGTTGTTAIVPGRLGKAIALRNGDNAATTCDYLSVPLVMPDQGTIAWWYKVESLYNYVTMFDNSVNSGDWEMWIYGRGELRGRIQGGTEVLADLDALSPDGNAIGDWFHIIFTWERDKDDFLVMNRLYVNGNLIDSCLGPWVDPGTNFFIAGGNNGNEGSDGIFDDIRIYDRVIYPTEMKLIYSLSDHNQDFSVNLADLQELTNQWLAGTPGCDSTPPFDYDMSCNVDLMDYNTFTQYWLLSMDYWPAAD